MINTVHFIFYIFLFFVLWYGAGLIIDSVEKFSARLRLSSFTVSFFVLGMLTSIPEMSVGFSAINDGQPEIFVGNLLGGIAIIFLFIIPLLAAVGGGFKLSHELGKHNLLLSLIVIILPSIFVIDKSVSMLEGGVLILSYVALFYFVERKKGLLDGTHSKVLDVKSYSLTDIVKVLLGVILIFAAGRYIVVETEYFSSILAIPSFYISLIILSFGTNLPELSLAVRAIIGGNKDIAFGDYIGSSAANTFLFGVFTILNRGDILTVNNFLTTLLFIFMGLSFFYYFAHVKHYIKRSEGFALLIAYLVFIVIEVLRF